MNAQGNPPETVVRACPKCGKKNRIPAAPRKLGSYTCGSCHSVIASGGSRKGFRGTPVRSLLSKLAPSRAHQANKRTTTSGRSRRRTLPKALGLCYTAWAVILATVSISNAIGPESWLLGSANLYMPQWVWALPAIVVIPWTLRSSPKWILLPIVFTLWVFGPLMGLVWHPGARPAAGGDSSLRVMQCNIKWARRDPQGLADEVLLQHPDLIQFQDSGGDIQTLGPISQIIAGWNIRSSGQYITASRLPLSQPTSIDISFPGGDVHHCTRILLTVGSRQVALYNVHLLTPRWGLMSVRRRDASGMDNNVEARLFEANKLAAVLRTEDIPVLLTGDLNAPMQSLVCREVMGDQFDDAFQESGSGYGYSYGRFTTEHLFQRLHLPDVGRPFVRIDHILYSKQFTADSSWTGSENLSDHVPVYADLRLK